MARDIRAGLENPESDPGKPDKPGDVIVDPLEQIQHGKTVRRHVQEFTCVFAILFLGIAGYLIWTGKGLPAAFGLFVSAIVLVAFGYLAPAAVRPVWASWMAFAEALGKVMTAVILSLCWTAVLLPTAFVLRVIGRKVMDLSCYEEGVESYWESREEKYHDFKLLERQF